jgi:tRNA (guanine37-N1)-methyltransferase
LAVPDVLLSGHHEAVRRWRKREALARTVDRRPDLIGAAELDDEEQRWLAEMRKNGGPLS